MNWTGLSEEDLSCWKGELEKEIALLKGDIQKKGKDFEEKIESWAKLYKENPGMLPKKVQSITGKVAHYNLARSTASPPITWRTACGWSYYGSQFTFVEPEENVTCQKCRLLCAKSQ